MFIIFVALLPPGVKFEVVGITPKSHLFEKKGDTLSRFLSGGIIFWLRHPWLRLRSATGKLQIKIPLKLKAEIFFKYSEYIAFGYAQSMRNPYKEMLWQTD